MRFFLTLQLRITLHEVEIPRRLKPYTRMLSAQQESGHHTYVYQYVWKPAAGEKRHAEQEFNNPMDKFAVKVIKNNETVGHLPCEYSQVLSWHFLSRDGKKCVKVISRRCHSKQLCGGMEIPCRLVFSCLSKVKINCLKEVLENKNRK